MSSVQRALSGLAPFTMTGAMSTPLMHVKPEAHSLKLAVMPPSVNGVVAAAPGTNNAQVPPQMLARSSGVVGAALTVKAFVAAFGELTAVTVEPGARSPVPVLTRMRIAGVVTVG